MGNFLYRPSLVTHFEIVESKLHPGKDCMYAQVFYYDKGEDKYKWAMLVTESLAVIGTFKNFKDINKGPENYGFVKFLKGEKEGKKFYFAHDLTEAERRNLRAAVSKDPLGKAIVKLH